MAAAASDWIRYWDEASSDYYYHRPATGETSWEQPDRWICGEGYESEEDSARRSRAGSSLPLEDEDDVDAPEEDLFVVRASLSGPPPLPAGGPPPLSLGAPPPLPVAAAEPSSAQREERRRRVLGEILSTERTYVAALQTLEKVYMVPMRMVADAGAKVAIFSHADLDTVFLNLDVLLKLHARFLERLEQEETSGHFGAILSGAAKDIKGCYTRYISNYAQAEAHISALASKAPDKHRYLEVCKSHPDAGGLDVRSFLIQPIQRVPRYRLLLEELLAHTEPGHPDEADLREALARIREVAAFINEETRVSATLCKLREVARRFAQPEVLEKSLVRQGRAFVREGELTKVFLFSDLLVYGVPTGRGYVQKGQIPLGEGTRVERLPRTEHLTHGFAVVDGHGKGYTWHGESEAETGEWFEEVQRAVRACQPERRPSSFDAVAILAMVARKTALEHFTAAKAGCTLIKFNHRDGRSSPRWVRISADGSAICWGDTKSKECKSMMALSKAVALMHGAKSAAFYRAQGAKKDRDWLCFSLLFRGRTLDFAATTAEGLFTWYLALAALVGPRSSEPILDEEALRARVAEMI